MKMSALLLVSLLGCLGVAPQVVAGADQEPQVPTNTDHVVTLLRARLDASNEVPTVISAATGRFRGALDVSAGTIEYELSYEGLEGTVTQAHIHVGQRFAAGGISIWLCANPPIMAPPGTQTCPASPATITGTITAADVVGPAGQGVPPGSFADAVEAILSGNAYANVHSTSAPGGEVRGQIRQVDRQR